MNLFGWFRYRLLVARTRPRRYRHLFTSIYEGRCCRLVEIGVFNGVHAEQMIQTAAVRSLAGAISYFGFDLFEESSAAELEAEFSGNKKPIPCTDVQRILEKTGASIRLFPGNTKVTLPTARREIGTADFIFIDGGHSIETIASDWDNTRELMNKGTTVVFDDYYVNRDPFVEGYGCQTLVDGLDRQVFDIELLPGMDAFDTEKGVLKIRMAAVKKK